MTQKEFIKKLDLEGYSYEIEGDKIIVTYEGDVDLEKLKTLPPGVEFMNEGYVLLNDLTSLPPGVEFKNGGTVMLNALTSIPPGVEFRNKEDVRLDALIGEWISGWEGNIRGVESKRLLNLMISKGIFKR